MAACALGLWWLEAGLYGVSDRGTELPNSGYVILAAHLRHLSWHPNMGTNLSTVGTLSLFTSSLLLPLVSNEAST